MHVRFFDESINAKLNRAFSTDVHHPTPFLDDTSMDHHGVFLAPPPNAKGSYPRCKSTPGCWPTRDPTLYGNVRAARQLFRREEAGELCDSIQARNL